MGGWWIPSSAERLEAAETSILRCLRSVYTCNDVQVQLASKSCGILSRQQCLENYLIRTISFNQRPSRSNEVPLVMVHGFASGLGLWILNYDNLADKCPLYAFDLLGFGRSSRDFVFSKDSQTCINEYVESFEKWREAQNIEKFVLLGHSFGAYLSFNYSLRYPDRVQHLILADPWGMKGKTKEDVSKLPAYVTPIAAVMKLFNPLAVLRATGPWAPGLVSRFRGDIVSRFSSRYTDDTIADYIYHCNVQNPAGETAFSNICSPLGWPRFGMLSKADQVPESLRITLIYGEESWSDKEAGKSMTKLLEDRGVEVEMKVMPRCTHHLYADEPAIFNHIVLNVMKLEKERLNMSSKTHSSSSTSK